MQVQRCPECGIRLTTNYCDICMRRVPFKGVPAKTTFQHVEGSSAHREENHECISFDKPEKKPKVTIRTLQTNRKKFAPKAKTTKVAAVGVIIAALSIITSVFGIVGDLIEDDPVPDYNYEAYAEDAQVPQITPMEIFNRDGIVVTADSAGLYYDDYTVSMTVQNNTDMDLTANSQLMSVNGYMVDSGFLADVAAGQTGQVLLQLDSYELETMGITKVGEIAFYLNFYDADEYDDIATSDLITLRTDAAGDMAAAAEVSGEELYHQDGVRILLQEVAMSSYGDCDIAVYIENQSGRTVSVSSDVIKLDGQEISGFLWDTLRPDTRTFDSAYLYDLDELEIEELSQIGQITMELVIEFYDGWYVEDTVYETVTFTP